MATVPNGKGIKALAVCKEGESLKPTEIGRPGPGPNDVRIKVLYCGMCHSDVHATNGDWGIDLYPMAPGHEIAGIVISSNSSKFTEGQKVGVGCMVESCKSCDLCSDGLEQHCPGMIQTYSSKFPKDADHDDCADYQTNGGYSEEIVVHEHFVFSVPEEIGMEYIGPLMCAGITTYSPLARFVKGKEDQKIAIVGFGGLGMMTAKLAKAMGAEVTILSRGLGKAEQAEAIGAELLSHEDEDKMGSLGRTFHTIIDTVSSFHEVAHILNTLKVDGNYCFLGAVAQPYPISAFQLLFNRYNISGSLIGGVPETSEMLKFCAEHSILPDIKVIHANQAASIYVEMQEGRGQALRHVIDMSTLPELFGVKCTC